MDDCFHQLSINPAMGRACSEIISGFHKFPTGSHVIYFRIKNEKQIEVVRILHESMDVVLQLTSEVGSSS